MQLSTNVIKQTVVEIMTVLNSKQFVWDSQTKQLFQKLSTGIYAVKFVHKDQVNLVLRTFMEIERKTYNLSSKLLPDIWKLFINLYFKIYPIQGTQSLNKEINNHALNNIQDFYNSINLIQDAKVNKNSNHLTQNFSLFLTLWLKLFSLSDIKTLQFAAISLTLLFNQSLFEDNLNDDEIKKIIECIDKMSLYIIKFNEKIKDFDTFQSFNKLLGKLQELFHKKYEKEINEGIKYLKQSFKFSQVADYSNIYLNTWQKLVTSRFLCLSKKKQSIEDIQAAIELLNRLKNSFFLERSINNAHSYQNKSISSLNISSFQVDHAMFCAIVQMWVNFKIIYDGVILKQENSEQKKKLLQDCEKTRVFLKEIFKILTKRQINVIMVRQLIKSLRIVNINTVVSQWKQVFGLMQQFLKSYPQNKTIIQFIDEKSYIVKNFSPCMKYPFTIELKVKGKSIPFKQQKILIQFIDSSSKQKIIITMRNYEKSSMIFSFVKVVKNNIWGKQQKEFQWSQYQANNIEIVLKSNKIKMFINNNDNAFLSMQNPLGKVDEMVLCDRQAGMGTTISQLLEFKVVEYSIFETMEKKQVDLVPFICPKYFSASKESMKENIKFNKCQKVSQQSFISLMESLGDLQLFMVILYHTLKKLKSQQDELLQLIRFVLKLMQQFTLYKHVQNKQLTVEEKQSRRKTIQCLGWFYAKQSKSVFVIFQLMRFLYIRGNRDNNQLLKFLCNFSYWKQFKLDKQMVIMMKIKELLKQATKQDQKISNLSYCKQLLFDMMLYLKQTGFKMADKQSCLRLHQIIFQTVYEQIRDIIQMNNNGRKVKNFMLEIFNFIQYLIGLISCLVNRKVNQESLDLTLTVELTMLLRDLAKLIFISKERKLINKQEIDVALQTMFKKQQKQLILPLALNAQQACDQRFNMYLGKILSQSKSLLTLIDTETTFFQQTQLKLFPIFSDAPSVCTQNKIHSNIINFGIYLSMLSQKTWNYMLFGMPFQEYSQRFCSSVWRISFYQLFKEKKYFVKVCKMLEFTPLPTNQYCLMKIFQAVLFCPNFEKQHLYRIIKSSNFTKSICPFKINQMLIKYLSKLEHEVLSNTLLEDNTYQNLKQQREEYLSLREQKIYYVLLHAQNVDFQSCQGIIECLKKKKTYNKYKVIIYEIILRSLIKHVHQKKQRKKMQRVPTNYFQNAAIQKMQKKRSRLYSNDETQINTDSYENLSTVFDSVRMMEPEDRKPQQKLQKTAMIIKSQLATVVIEALEFYLSGTFTIEKMRSFFGLASNEDNQALRDNFIINVEGMLKALKSSQTNKSSIQFQKYLSFIEVYLKKFSLDLIYENLKTFNIKVQKNALANIDESKKSRNKILYRTVYVDLIKHSTEFYLEEINKRRLQLHTLERTWSLISRRHNYFWNLFVSSQKYYSLGDITSDLGERFLLKISTDKPKIDLPKMMNKQSLIFSVSLLSDKNDNIQQSQPSTLFDDCDELLRIQLQQVEAKTKDRIRKGSTQIVKEVKTRKYRVLLVTNHKTYQGLIYQPQKKLLRFQQIYPTDKLYDKICAHEQQKRNDDDVQKQPLCFDIFLGEEAKIFYRRYLFFDTAMEIFANERSSFFCFDSEQKRDIFCTTYLKNLNVLNYEMIKKFILEQTSKWTKGLISNYEYLMKVNQFGNRSLNDLSQYYVMPWTVGQFQQNIIDKKFIKEQKYFRDLTKPLGRLFDKKWKEIQSRFKMCYSQYNKQQNIFSGGIQPFLYGSFYSNPAIVTNYMIRVQPYSSLHYHLQSQKIDLADRLFFQVSDQYLSLSRNMGDMKELIPEFYNNPEFLKNKSRLNLGARQNKEIVNDVRLPKWAASAQQFIFKMKYFLESPLMSKYLHGWIDLIFGQKAKKENAIKADNLFMSEIYGPKDLQIGAKQKKGQSKNKIIQNQKDVQTDSFFETQSRILFNKEFGQLPLTLFNDLHPVFDYNQDYFSFKGTVQHMFTLSAYSKKDDYLKIKICQNFCLVSTAHSLELLDTGSQDRSQKQNFKLVSELCLQNEITNCQIFSGKKLDASLPCIFYIQSKQNKLCSRFIKKTKFFGSLQLRDEYCVAIGSLFKWINDQILVVTFGNRLKVYSFDQCSLININTGSNKKSTLLKIQQSKPALAIKQFPTFTEHKADITLIEVNNALKMILSLDAMNKIFILKYYPNELKEINTFQLRGLRFDEKVTKIMLHKLSIIVCYTSQNRLFAFTFYGELIGVKEVGFKSMYSNFKRQLPNCVYFFDQTQSSELLIGTSHGNLWKVDLFEFLKSPQPIQQKELWFEKISLNTKQQQFDIRDIKIKRYGRHWQIYVISINKQGKKVISKVKCLTLKNYF